MKDRKYTLTLYGEAAAELGTDIAVVRGLVKARGITPKPVPHNGNAKGLDRGDMAILRRALGRAGRKAEAGASAR
jgi:hypothetical protein